MIALQSLLVVAGMVLASYTLSILLLYKNKDKDRLGKTKGPQREPVCSKQTASYLN